MANERGERDDDEATPSIGAGYATHQLAKALAAAQRALDDPSRSQAEIRIGRWRSILENILSGNVDYGSRTPLRDTPVWATLEVATGGFATGNLLAEGPLQPHESAWLAQEPLASTGHERRVLNRRFLSDVGMAELSNRLSSGCFEVHLPEESVLLLVAWLLENDHADEARELLEQVGPWLARLRFYPVPTDRLRRFDGQVQLQNVGASVSGLKAIEPNERILTQREATEVWCPFYDRMVGMFAGALEAGDTFQVIDEDWIVEARGLVEKFHALRRRFTRCSKPERKKGHFAQLLRFLKKTGVDRQTLTRAEAEQVRFIVLRALEKRGQPGSERCQTIRGKQRSEVAAPLFSEIAQVACARLASAPQDEGLDDPNEFLHPVTVEEERAHRVRTGSAIPETIRRKISRCVRDSIDGLIERGLVTSGETLARLLPQVSSSIQAAAIADPKLRNLYAANYRAFRSRRSLLLLNLQKQVQLEELPWVAVMNRHRSGGTQTAAAGDALRDAARTALTAFPHAIVPNKLVQEFQALSKSAGLAIPWVEEIAADIFMGEFSAKFVGAAHRAASKVAGTLYARYYDIDCAGVLTIKMPAETTRGQQRTSNKLGEYCAQRAGTKYQSWQPANSGTIIEQQQIVTTHNLVEMFSTLGLEESLRSRLPEMARRCFEWICRRQTMRITDWHAKLVRVKNTAYAWRQMLFYLSHVAPEEVASFVEFANEHLAKQPQEFAKRFRPAMIGLQLAATGATLTDKLLEEHAAKRFLGWTTGRHWLLA